MGDGAGRQRWRSIKQPTRGKTQLQPPSAASMLRTCFKACARLLSNGVAVPGSCSRLQAARASRLRRYDTTHLCCPLDQASNVADLQERRHGALRLHLLALQSGTRGEVQRIRGTRMLCWLATSMCQSLPQALPAVRRTHCSPRGCSTLAGDTQYCDGTNCRHNPVMPAAVQQACNSTRAAGIIQQAGSADAPASRSVGPEL